MKKQKQTPRSDQQAINIDELIDEMPEAVLRMLHNRIVNRLSALQRQETMQSMAEFRPGDRVSFQTERGEIITGVLVRLNKKSVTVHTEKGNRWNVAPQLLTRTERPQAREERENISENQVIKTVH